MRVYALCVSVCSARWVPAWDMGRPDESYSLNESPTVGSPTQPPLSRTETTKNKNTLTSATMTPEPQTSTRPKYEMKQPYVLELQPFVEIGIRAVRPGPPRIPPPGHTPVCPSDRAYCIDYKASDNGTCMYPDPLEIKRCYDNSCINSAWNALVYRTHGENSYCKDFMTPAGRVCQWADNQACTCNAKSITYYDAEFIPPGESIPEGFSQVYPCTYPLDVIRRAAEDAARKSRDRRKGRSQKRRGRKSKDESSEDEDESADDRRRGLHQRDDDESVNSTQGLSTGSLMSVVTMFVVLLWSF